MSITKKDLLGQLKKTVQGGSNIKAQALTVHNQLLGAVQTSNSSGAVNTVSGSGIVSIPFTQPANTVLEDVVCICTSPTAHDSGKIAFQAGTTVGGVDIAAAVVDAIATTGTSTTLGQGTSIHAKVTTALQGNAPMVLVAGACGPFSTDRTLYGQVSASVGPSYFTTGTGEFKVIAKYYNV
tara:strand:+ start:66 stop:608 length:543 start_codon:yes stop_codon:yes gene_type:complete